MWDDTSCGIGSIGMYDDPYPVQVHFVDWINFTVPARVFDNGNGTTQSVVKGTAAGIDGTVYTIEFHLVWTSVDTGQTAIRAGFMDWRVMQQGSAVVSETRNLSINVVRQDDGTWLTQVDKPLVPPVETHGYSLSGFLGIHPYPCPGS